MLYAFDLFWSYQQATVCPLLINFFDYLERTWFQNATWSIENWTGYRRLIRTNNDLEGWHRRLNVRAGGDNLVLYVLIPLLYQEAEIVDVTCRLVAEHKLKSCRRKASRDQQTRLWKLWDDYDERDIITTESFKKKCNLVIPAANFSLS